MDVPQATIKWQMEADLVVHLFLHQSPFYSYYLDIHTHVLYMEEHTYSSEPAQMYYGCFIKP